MRYFSILVAVLLLTVFAGCSPETPTPTPPSKPTITSFTATPSSLPAGGGSVTLSWEVKDAKTLSVDGGVGEVIGSSKTVNVTSTKTFTLTATSDGGTVTQNTSVTVAEVPAPTGPKVISVDPPNGATGVKSDVIITITFSEKMDKAATEAAYQSSDLPASEVTFFWNDDGTVLEIESKNFLEYASGENKSVVAKSYTFSFSNTAKDSSGNALEGFSSGFSTFRKINEKLFGEAQLDGEVTEGGEYFPNANTIRVGDNTKDEAIRGFLSFNLTDIPQGAVGVDAVLLVFQEDFVSNPYLAFNSNPCVPAPFTPVCATNFRMLAESVTYGDSLAAAFDTPSRGTFFLFGTISSPPYDTPERGGFMLAYVSAAFNDDLANRTLRGNRSQYRLMFPVKTNNDGKLNYVNITPSEGRVAGRPFLSVTYLAP